MSVTIAKWTLDEYHHMIEVGLLEHRQVELLNGEIVEMSPEGEPHAYYSTETDNYLRKVLGDRVTIRPGKPITIISSNSEPEPDLAIVQPLGREYLHHHPYPENIFWLIEFSNTSLSKDTEIKRKTYATAGIREYWVMDLKHHQLKVFRDPVSGDYQSELVLTTGTINPLAFPEVEISVQQLLEG
ncbi:MAG: Uma2 family endonuclease [Leptolyngbyaceae cyanobacterium RM2_2_4]|nr:Uma2 family endonuclease [Leptolyngbyaceae cyanobacterium SM1_4_3]NJN90720.1 Uma2 family endonuclease [Leptolyngbyaceae cyanobacterium SL_5_14]NJO49258.1 Uma2 family endonuclease [Leptolyngbyaceae cyanobacterium RM2_2_4]